MTMRLDVHHHHDLDPKTAEAWRLMLEALGSMNRKLEKIMVDTSKTAADFDAFVAKVSAKFADMGKQMDDLKAAQDAVDALDKHIADASAAMFPEPAPAAAPVAAPAADPAAPSA